MAQDTQAIFEFVQNAVDADSTDFFMYYDEKQFIALNNGHPFTDREIKSILNVGDSTKNSKDGVQYIGEFGVGFKLIHRMVGEQNGVARLVNDYKGPLLFSWNNESQLKSLLGVNHPDQLKVGSEDLNDDTPWFFKFLLTCVPCLPQDLEPNLRNLDYELVRSSDQPLFGKEELSNFNNFLQKFWNDRSQDLSKVNLSEGSLFYLRLGDNKKQLLDEDYKHYRKGLNYSLKFIETIGDRKGLKNIFFNNKDQISTEGTNLSVDEPIIIEEETSEYEPLGELLKDKEQGVPIVFRLAYEPYEKGKEYGQLKQSPNFYKYFPMGKEVYGLNFIVHSNAFRIEASRREFQQSEELNKRLLTTFTDMLKERLTRYQLEAPKQYRDIFLSILFSDTPTNKDKDSETGWIEEALYNPLFDYIRENIPVGEIGYKSADSVIIKDTAVPVPNSVFEEERYWFYYEQSDKVHESICKRAKDNKLLGLRSWDISRIIQEMPGEAFTEWYKRLTGNQKDLLLDELENQLDGSLDDTFWQNVCKIDGIYNLIEKCEDNKAQKNFLTSFERIELKADEITEQNRELISVLELAKRFQKDEEFIDAFQDQFVIVSEEGEEFPLKEVAQNNEITFKIDDKEYKLLLSEILPETYEKTSGIFGPVQNALSEINLEVNNLLGVSKARGRDQIAVQIHDDYESYTPIQFVFLLLYSIESERTKFKRALETTVALTALDYMLESEIPLPEEEKYQKYFDDLFVQSSVYPDDLAVEQERLPRSIVQWIESDIGTKKSKLIYLSETGLKTGVHPHIKLRKRLLENRADSSDIDHTSGLDRYDLVKLFDFLTANQVVLNGAAKGVFNILTKKASGEGVQTKLIAVPVIKDCLAGLIRKSCFFRPTII